MCEAISAWSRAFVDWSPTADEHRLTSAISDHLEYTRHLLTGFSVRPTKEEEDEAAAVMERADQAIAARFGLGPVETRYMLCSVAAASGKPIVEIARAAAATLISADSPA